MLNDYKSTAQNRAVPKVTIMIISIQIHLYLCMMHRLIFHETIIVNEAQCHLQAYYVKCRLTKWWHERILLCYQLRSIMKVSYAHQACIYLVKNTEKTLILWNIITI